MLYKLRVKCYNRKLVSPPNFNAPNKLRYNTIQHLLNTVCFLRYTHDSQKINLLSLNNYHGEGMWTIRLFDGKILKICTTYLYELLRTDSKFVEYNLAIIPKTFLTINVYICYIPILSPPIEVQVKRNFFPLNC